MWLCQPQTVDSAKFVSKLGMQENRRKIVFAISRNKIKLRDFQLTFTCYKSATETLEKGLKYVQS